MSESKDFYSHATLLGQDHRISTGILKETACMDVESRVLIADLLAVKDIYKIIDKIPDMDIPELIDKVLLKLLKNEGYAKWLRDVVTDMAIKKGEAMPYASMKNKKKTDPEPTDDESEQDSE